MIPAVQISDTTPCLGRPVYKHMAVHCLNLVRAPSLRFDILELDCFDILVQYKMAARCRWFSSKADKHNLCIMISRKCETKQPLSECYTVCTHCSSFLHQYTVMFVFCQFSEDWTTVLSTHVNCPINRLCMSPDVADCCLAVRGIERLAIEKTDACQEG